MCESVCVGLCVLFLSNMQYVYPIMRVMHSRKHYWRERDTVDAECPKQRIIEGTEPDPLDLMLSFG